MKRTIKRALTLLLSLTLLLAALPATASADSVTGFPDVPENAWYVKYLGPIMQAQAMMGVNNIISGMKDKDGTLKFFPQEKVTRGQFLKMIFEAAQSSGNEVSLTVNETHRKTHWAGKYYTMALADNVLVIDPYASGSGVQQMFECTAQELNSPISRYEMAVILNNVCRNVAMQKTVNVLKPEDHITDYADIPERFLTAVEQMYGKGLLTGDGKGAFNGWDSLTRAEAVTVVYRFLFVDTIQGDGLQDWASYSVIKLDETGNIVTVTDRTGDYLLVDAQGNPDPSKSFANQLQAGGHINAWGNLDDWAKTQLFGSPYKSYFSSAYDAGNHIVTVNVPIWTVDKAGQKIASTVGIQVNTVVADEVHDIFQMIFDDPEQFPIYGGWSAGGARYTDTMRHSWGCAIDINALYNCECNFWPSSGALQVTCGYGWHPLNGSDWRFLGSMSTENSFYSIGSKEGEYGYSVVKAFKTYGWGWGGNGYGLKSDGHIKYDYMHFSILPSGG